ncbi:transposase IS66 [Striga asiatica]|uniref:Transposase IS66 n=1 Tax=Striga asiatica TaxID=4170 RepID=A0A5A7QJV7_STRAF|nr:transposase IS66 [Striga asiatica]
MSTLSSMVASMAARIFPSRQSLLKHALYIARYEPIGGGAGRVSPVAGVVYRVLLVVFGDIAARSERACAYDFAGAQYGWFARPLPCGGWTGHVVVSERRVGRENPGVHKVDDDSSAEFGVLPGSGPWVHPKEFRGARG